MRQATHPGPPSEPRLEIVPGKGRPVDVTLSAECSLEEAVAAALAEVKGTAWLVIEAAGVATLDTLH